MELKPKNIFFCFSKVCLDVLVDFQSYVHRKEAGV